MRVGNFLVDVRGVRTPACKTFRRNNRLAPGVPALVVIPLDEFRASTALHLERLTDDEHVAGRFGSIRDCAVCQVRPTLREEVIIQRACPNRLPAKT